MAKIKGPISRITTDIDFDKTGKQVSYLAVPSSTNESAYGIVTVPIAVIKNGMNLTDVDPFNQKIVLGAVLMTAVLLDTLKRRGSR